MGSKVIFMADVHLGVQGRLKDVMWSLESVAKYAQDNDIYYILVLGDLFHNRHNVGLDVINAAYSFFKKEKESGRTWIVFPGNHDMFMKSGWDITSVKPLQDVVTVFSKISLIKIGNQRFWIYPFVYFEDVYMQVLDKIHDLYEPGDVLLTHVGVAGATLNECFLVKSWSTVSFAHSKFDRVYSGHFHNHQQVGSNMWFVGSPIPFKFDEGVVDHGFMTFDLETREHEFHDLFETSVVPGRPPGYLTVTLDMLPSLGDTIGGNNVRVMLDRDYAESDLKRIKEILLKKKVKKVSWMKLKEEDVDTEEDSPSVVSMLTDPDDMIRAWYKKDGPDHIDVEYLINLNKEVVNTAEVE